MAYPGMEDEGSKPSKGRMMETCLELVRRLTGPHKENWEGTVGEMQGVPTLWRPPVPVSGVGPSSREKSVDSSGMKGHVRKPRCRMQILGCLGGSVS